MTFRFFSLAMLLTCLTPGVADTLFLENGGKIEGTLIERKDGLVRFQTKIGRVGFKEADVVRIVLSKSAQQVYEQRKRELSPMDLSGHFRLAQWCKSKGLQRQMRVCLEQVVEHQADHAGARRLMGQIKVGKRWLPRRQGMRALGYIWHHDKWCRPDQLTQLQREQAAVRRRSEFKQRVGSLLARITRSDEKARIKARDELIAFARNEGVHQLVEVAGQVYREYTSYWAARRKVVTEIQLGFTQVRQPMRTLALNLGGTSTLPVTIQLPQVTSISAKTAAILPGGSSR